MADGLGVTPEEWKDLKEKIEESFWVLRIIGSSIIPPPLRSEVKSMTQDILHYLTIATDFPVVNTSSCLPSFLPADNPLTMHFISRDYGCLTYDFLLFWVYDLSAIQVPLG